MNNPFETGHIKNYILLYVSVVVIMVLFFIASTLFNDVQKMDKKIFNHDNSKFQKAKIAKKKDANQSGKFVLLKKAY